MRRPEIKIMLVLPPLVLMGGAVKNPWVDPATHGFSGLGTQGRNTPGDPGFTSTHAQHCRPLFAMF